MEYEVFDSLLDATFVVNRQAVILYCNDLAASLCQSSVRRMVGKGKLHDYITFEQGKILPFNENSVGFAGPSLLIETAFDTIKNAKSGKVQLSVRPIGEDLWVLFLRDVSLEETLAAKYRSELQQKEDYAKNLEKIVEARTAEIRRINKTLEAILDSLGQGFFTFNAEGDCGPVYTRACDMVIEGLPKGRKVWDLLKVKGSDREHFQEWMRALMTESLPFEDLKDLGPNLFPHSAGRHVTLEYYPIRTEGEAISEIVVVATDKTAEYEAQSALEAERRHAAMIAGFVKNKEQFLKFIAGFPSQFQRLRSLEQTLTTRKGVVETLRLLHTLEGESAVFAIGDLRAFARTSQHVLEPMRDGGAATPAILQAYAESLTQMENGYKQILSANAEVFGIGKYQKGRTVEITMDSVQEFRERIVAGADQTLLNDYDQRFLMVAVSSVVRHYENLVLAVAEKLGKKVEPLKIKNGNLRINPEKYQPLFSALVHAFRNSIDHGLEYPGEREDAGKSRAGRIELEFDSRPDSFEIRLIDDGRGIDPRIVRARLAQIYPDKDFSAMGDEEVIQQVALPGFTSREKVGEFSGRGVGLDALRSEVMNLNGKLVIRSKAGKGATIQIVLPSLGKTQRDLRSA